MSTESVCPNCQTILGENPAKCDHCRAFVAGRESAAKNAVRPVLSPLVVVALILSLYAIWASSPSGQGRPALLGSQPPSPAAVAPPVPAPPRVLASPRPDAPIAVNVDLADGPDGARLKVRAGWNLDLGDGTFKGNVRLDADDHGVSTTVDGVAVDASRTAPSATGSATQRPVPADSPGETWTGGFSLGGVDFHVTGQQKGDDPGSISISVGAGAGR